MLVEVRDMLVLIDNFAEFRQSYEDLIPDLSSLIREGLSKGIYFAVTADQLGSVPGRTQSLFNQKMTLKLADAADRKRDLVPDVTEWQAGDDRHVGGRAHVREHRLHAVAMVVR